MNRSERPFIFNHMEISLDGKIMGKYLWIPETNTESDPFYRTIFGLEAKFTFQAIVEGRTTIEDNQTGYAETTMWTWKNSAGRQNPCFMWTA